MESGITSPTQVFSSLKQFAEESGVQQEIKELSMQYARKIVDTMFDENGPKIEQFHSINLSQDKDSFIQYALILDFFKQSGLSFPLQVLTFESQHPEFQYSRKELCNELGLNHRDPSPLLMQIIQKITKKAQ